MRHSSLLVCLVACCLAGGALGAQYNATWASLNSRPIPDWWLEAKIGIFVHMGVFSVPAYRCRQRGVGLLSAEWYWQYLNGDNYSCIVDYHTDTFGSNFFYQDFANSYRLELFDADEWALLFKNSGAKWVVFTSKHHEGFANWPSAQAWNWNSATVGPHRDVVGELARAVRRAGLKFGAYHSLFEWFNPLFLADQASNFTTSSYVDEIVLPMLHDLVDSYRPSVIWSDGDWVAQPSYWKSEQFLAWLYNDSPVADEVVTNDRWGVGTNCQDGGFWTCSDRYNPGKLVNHAWENAFTIQTASWGFAQNAPITQYLSIDDIVDQVVSTVAFGGNVLINVGPTAAGVIPAVFQERLLQLGAFLAENGQAIYATAPWSVAQNQSDVFGGAYYTSSLDPSSPTIYAIVLKPDPFSPDPLVLNAPVATPSTTVAWLTDPAVDVAWKPAVAYNAPGIVIQLPSRLPSVGAWAFAMKNLANA